MSIYLAAHLKEECGRGPWKRKLH